MPSPGCLRCGSQSCSCVLIYDPVTGFPTPGATLSGAGSTTNPIRVRVPSCEDVQDCVGPMLGWTTGFAYNDLANRWEGTGTPGDVLTLLAGGNVQFAPAGGGGTGPTWAGVAGNGITITPGGTAGHSPTISVLAHPSPCNSLVALPAGLYVPEAFSTSFAITDSDQTVTGPLADGTNVTGIAPNTYLMINNSLCDTAFAMVWQSWRFNIGGNSPAGTGTVAVGHAQPAGWVTFGFTELAAFVNITGTYHRVFGIASGVIPAAGSQTFTVSGGFAGASPRNTTGIASIRVRISLDGVVMYPGI